MLTQEVLEGPDLFSETSSKFIVDDLLDISQLHSAIVSRVSGASSQQIDTDLNKIYKYAIDLDSQENTVLQEQKI